MWSMNPFCAGGNTFGGSANVFQSGLIQNNFGNNGFSFGGSFMDPRFNGGFSMGGCNPCGNYGYGNFGNFGSFGNYGAPTNIQQYGNIQNNFQKQDFWGSFAGAATGMILGYMLFGGNNNRGICY